MVRWLLLAAVLPGLIIARAVPRPVWHAIADLVIALARAYVFVSARAAAIALVVLVLVLGRLVLAAVRFAWLPAAAKRNYPAAVWHRYRWRWLCRNLGLAHEDQHRHAIRPVAFGTAAPMPADRPARPRLRFPRARFRADEFGLIVRVKPVPKVGRGEFERAAPHIADAWRCHRVSVQQPGPGRLIVRGMRRDPLAEPVSAGILPPFDLRHLVLGRDELGDVRRVDLANLSGSVIAGNPGRGKTESALGMAVQLVPSPAVELYILDGGGGLDWSSWAGCAVAYADDDLAAAEDLLLGLHAKMMGRRRRLEADLGVRNGWKRGPTPDHPLRWLIIEEASAFFDLDAVRGDRDRERRVRACRGLTAQLLRRGRAPMHHTTLVCQKPTGEGGLPPSLRDMAGLRWCFGVATTETAAAALGDDIRQYETMRPTLLQGPEHVGVAAVLLQTGLMPYTLVKFPEIGEDLADDAARRARQLAVPLPGPAVSPVDATA